MVLKHQGKKKYTLILAFCILLNVLFMIFWGFQKYNLYWDEYHTYKNAHDVTGAGSFSEYINDVYECDKWNSVSELKSIYCISDDVNIQSGGEFFSLMIKGGSFPAIFSVWQNCFFQNQMNKWAGISLNIVLLVISVLVMYSLMNKLANEQLALGTCIMYMFSGFAVSMTLFVRSYMYSVLLVIIEVYMLYVIISQKSAHKAIIAMLLNWICIYFAYCCNPFAGVYSIGMIISAMVVFLFSKRKKWFLGAYCGISTLGGIVFLVRSGYLNILFHMKESISNGNLGMAKNAIFSNFLETTPGLVWDRLIMLIRNYCTFMFEKKIILLVCVVTLIMLLITRMIKIKSLEATKSDGFEFAVIIWGGLLVFVAFSIAFGTSPLIRYYSWMFPMSIISFFLAAYYFFEPTKLNICSFAMFACVILCSIGTFFNDKIENLYREDKSAYEFVSKSKTYDIVIDNGFFVLQNCVYFATDDSEVYYSKNNVPLVESQEGEYLLWIDQLEAHPDIISQIDSQNCTYCLLDRTYLAEIYSVKNKY